jgi:3'5'-cyclic nucleotide phosphodiesterase
MASAIEFKFPRQRRNSSCWLEKGESSETSFNLRQHLRFLTSTLTPQCRHWLTLRPEKVDCKGKGLMTTYWCEPNASLASSGPSELSHFEAAVSQGEDSYPEVGVELQRLIEWNFDVFSSLLRDIVKYRMTAKKQRHVANLASTCAFTSMCAPLDEVQEVLSVPAESPIVCDSSLEADIGEKVSIQLEKLIQAIARRYRTANAFHNFHHASHVVMSTTRLLERIAEHLDEATTNVPCSESKSDGVAIDPLTKFAIVFAALIHDIDHPGVSNAQLVLEHSDLAAAYNGKSIAEQNSIVTSWDLLSSPEYVDLQNCICATDAELQHFRQIVANVVMATDLFDKDLKAMRESRWTKSFEQQSKSHPSVEDSNRRATIILDLVIQASDVSHTMQHFTVYKTWNFRLLTEMYSAYRSGRAAKDPLDGWYEGELWFFDNYVIPLAQKLRECNVFGVSCDEFLHYATDNRMEWEEQGREIVREAAEYLRSLPASSI